MEKGKLIVFEGIDGSGKSAHYRRVCARLEAEGIDYRHIVFPRYDNNSSALIKMYLGGDFGSSPNDVNAYAASTFYAVDRFAAYRTDWGSAYNSGKFILSDRYTTSNAVHQASKLPEGEREAYLRWLFDLEYGRMGLPEPDLVVYLDLPTELSEAMLRQRQQKTGTHADIHEQDEAYLRACRENARAIARTLGWTVIHCDREGRVRPAEDIHREIWELARKLV